MDNKDVLNILARPAIQPIRNCSPEVKMEQLELKDKKNKEDVSVALYACMTLLERQQPASGRALSQYLLPEVQAIIAKLGVNLAQARIEGRKKASHTFSQVTRRRELKVLRKEACKVLTIVNSMSVDARRAENVIHPLERVPLKLKQKAREKHLEGAMKKINSSYKKLRAAPDVEDSFERLLERELLIAGDDSNESWRDACLF